MINNKALIDALQAKLDQIVAEEGYQEMADGFDQAFSIVKQFVEFDRLVEDFRPVCTFSYKESSICCLPAEKERGEPWRCEEHRGM
jgi:hypothetical protein